jgi:alginate O-acetyltransferase complex protein AlgI
MLFNSFIFAIFFIIVFIIYWSLCKKNLKIQNIFILTVSYIFYGWWNWKFIIIIILFTLFNYLTGIIIDTTEKKNKRKILLISNIIINIGLLGIFKYYNFFIDSFISILTLFGIKLNWRTLNIILPIGISFYVFQTIGYIIDIYYKRIDSTRNIIAFSAFVSFFPQLLAGPIGRSTQLLPQFFYKREFDLEKAKDGMRQILWGLFTKMVIADNCAVYVDKIFNNYETLPASTLSIGAIYFSIQIYADFSGYSNMAIGLARLLGFNLARNFSYPYFSTNISEFWKRWHISLSTWFRDYLFLPLAFSIDRKFKSPTFMNIKSEVWSYSFAIMITWFFIGLWHGANWTFIIWGLIHGFYLIWFNAKKNIRKRYYNKYTSKHLVSRIRLIQILYTLSLTTIAWIFFRADNLFHAVKYIQKIMSKTILTYPHNLKIIPLIIFFIGVEWIQKNKQHGLQINHLPVLFRWLSYYLLIFMIGYFGAEQKIFIYFQF